MSFFIPIKLFYRGLELGQKLVAARYLYNFQPKFEKYTVRKLVNFAGESAHLLILECFSFF